jgi:hypothetical protein
MQRGAVPAEPPAEALLVYQTAQRPARRRRPLVVRWPSLLGVADHAAECGLDRRAKGGPVRRYALGPLLL